MGIEETRDLAKEVRSLVSRLDSSLEKFKGIQEAFSRQEERIDRHEKTLFGDGDSQRGLIAKQERIEDRFAIFWTSMGVLVSAVIVASVNLFVHK